MSAEIQEIFQMIYFSIAQFCQYGDHIQLHFLFNLKLSKFINFERKYQFVDL